MANLVSQLGDKTSKSTVPDFESERAYHWMHLVSSARGAGTVDSLPRKPRKGLAEESFFQAVDTRLSRKSFTMGVSFDTNGKLIRE